MAWGIATEACGIFCYSARASSDCGTQASLTHGTRDMSSLTRDRAHPCPLRWKEDSQPLDYQGNASFLFSMMGKSRISEKAPLGHASWLLPRQSMSYYYSVHII